MTSDPVLIQMATQLKDAGNGKFREKDFPAAIEKYQEAIGQAEQVKERNAEVDKLSIAILQNMSVCTNNTEDWRSTISNCSKALDIDGSAKKALYLRSVAYGKVGELAQSMADIVAAIKLDPADTNLRAHHAAIKK